MTRPPLEFHPGAEEEYLTSLDWYRGRSLKTAASFEKEFQRAITIIEKAPERWPGYFLQCRRYILHQFPFSVVYRIYPSQILVVAVAHAHRRPEYWKGRID